MIAVTQESETVYEGSLTVDGEDEPYSVVVIYQPDENSLLVNIFETDRIHTYRKCVL
jgi:hypothetical protein